MRETHRVGIGAFHAPYLSILASKEHPCPIPTPPGSAADRAQRRLRNRAVKKAIKLKVRDVFEAAKQAPADKLQTDLKAAFKQLDKAAAKRVIHPNTAARRKSQLARLARARSQPAASA